MSRHFPNLAVYDLDGTLVDSICQVHEILNGLRAELGKRPLEVGQLVPWISLGGIELMINALEVRREEAESHLKTFRARYLAEKTPKRLVYDGVFEALEHFQERHCSLAICTNKPRNLVEKVLSETGLANYFPCVVAGGDLPTQKPNPANLLCCLEHFDLQPSQAIFIGDSRVDQMTAESADVPFIFFSAGYDDGVFGIENGFTISRHSETSSLFQ
ncbi:MAG: HAD hydrolase-like protein [Betaproteobacteria bacterium]|nr:HAD hydrolase-like protein [Betaproteobacteria bacterium]